MASSESDWFARTTVILIKELGNYVVRNHDKQGAGLSQRHYFLDNTNKLLGKYSERRNIAMLVFYFCRESDGVCAHREVIYLMWESGNIAMLVFYFCHESGGVRAHREVIYLMWELSNIAPFRLIK